MKYAVVVFVLLVLFSLICSVAISAVPNLINYQGLVEDSDGNLIHGYFDLTFTFYPDEEGTDPLWSESRRHG